MGLIFHDLASGVAEAGYWTSQILAEVPQLPSPRPALRRQAELGLTRYHHTPLISEAPDQHSDDLFSFVQRQE